MPGQVGETSLHFYGAGEEGGGQVCYLVLSQDVETGLRLCGAVEREVDRYITWF